MSVLHQEFVKLKIVAVVIMRLDIKRQVVCRSPRVIRQTKIFSPVRKWKDRAPAEALVREAHLMRVAISFAGLGLQFGE